MYKLKQDAKRPVDCHEPMGTDKIISGYVVLR